MASTRTRHDILELRREGAEFAALAQAEKGLGRAKARMEAWLDEVTRVATEPFETAVLLDLREGLVPVAGFFKDGKPVSTHHLAGGLRLTVQALGRIASTQALAPTTATHAELEEFLRACLFEDKQLGLGAKLTIPTVAATARQDVSVARRVLVVAVQEGVAQQDEPGDEFLIDRERVSFRLDQLARSVRIAHAVPAAADPAEKLKYEWRDFVDALRATRDVSSNPSLPARQLHATVGGLEARARTLLGERAPHLIPQFDAAVRRISKVDRDLDAFAGEVSLLPVLAQMEERLPVIEAIPASPKEVANVSPIPKGYEHLEPDLRRFWQDTSFENSVFVMMKFPDPDHMQPWQVECLDTLFTATEAELARHGLVARRADKKTYAASKQLWDNLCVHMIGCKFGVAILEDHVGDELNPNVALEYGFMKALARDVILLKERAFKHIRADIVGTIPKPFAIATDHKVGITSVKDAVHNWLTDAGVGPKRAR